ncbi:uncharacterized protein CANTADRAFT_53529 [Suhomyces tanzawaensis NRRL Y-17324]|uniref:HRQ family protein 2 n=1 Tax=Suhomyces tanzawaensis NRRL Y-17324 TaxID=984487 RepID=A0A1E4SG12_9ASCO|nr:uncharacterized protein CANTADRAFT_53529 [Suhomyces tanzawaensis NRRL Y-17324]ODV78405.1 hypothetical protein CANTADRAFT_53529 [Suhomyces tanzawaensis NRRL Y-17324]
MPSSTVLNILLGVFLVVVVAYFEWKRNQKSVPSPAAIAADKISPVDPLWKWDLAPPFPIRPFVNKRNFNISMGIRNLSKTPEEWLLIEDTYLEQTRLRKKYSKEYPDKTTLAYNNSITTLAIREFYDIVINFLLKRYPQYFVATKLGGVQNAISGESFPRSSNNQSPQDLVKYLAYLIEEDFLILIKDEPTNPEAEYILRASVTGFPAGFDPSVNHNQPISFIHEPVPQYENRLKSLMHNFFNKLQPKDLWVRHNWSIQTHKSYFSLGSNHGREGEIIKELEFSEIDFENACFLRVERQCLTRLPRLRADIMTVRTYLTPLAKVKEEGLGPELIKAIDLLPDYLAFYKKRGAWGKAVKQYLSE